MRRSRILLAILIAALVTAASSVSSRAASFGFSTPPPGVAPEQWHPLSDSLGIAVQEQTFAGRSELYGTFMVREGGTWRRVTIAPGLPGMVPAR